MALTLSASHLGSFGLEPNGKNRMKQFLKMTSAMLALALSR
jgi:hypothetical protein